MTAATLQLKRMAVALVLAVATGTGGLTGLPVANATDPSPPLNDAFPGVTITGLSGQVSSTLVGASVETREDPRIVDWLNDVTIWWTWQATSTGTVTFDTCLSDPAYPTRVWVTEGTDVNDLPWVALGSDDCLGGGNAVLQATAGHVYHVAVGAYNAAPDNHGDVTLRWDFTTSAPANDAFPGTAISGSSGTASVQSALATVEASEPFTVWGKAPATSVWWSWTAPSSGSFLFDTSHSGTWQSVGVYTDSDPGSPSVEGLTLVAERDGQAAFEATAGTTYRIRSAGDLSYYGAPEPGSHLLLTWAETSPPANDDYVAATELTGSSGTVTGSNVGATGQTGEYAGLDWLGETSVWWKWQASADGVLDANMLGSDFPAEMAVLTQTDPASPDWENVVWMAFNDGFRMSVDIPAVRTAVMAGQTYYIGVGGQVWSNDVPPGYMGDVVLNWVFREDTADPDTSITSATTRKEFDGTTGSYVIIVQSDGTDDVAVRYFECKLDDGDWASCWGYQEYVNVTPGTHDVYVRAVDYLDHRDGTPAHATVTVTADTTAPVVSGLTATIPKGKASANTVVVSFSAHDSDDPDANLVTECRLDSGAWVACTSGYVLTGVPGGLHTISVRSTDPYGNTGSASVQVRMKGPRTIR